MSNIGQKIIKRLKDFADSLSSPSYKSLELLKAMGSLPKYEVEYFPRNQNYRKLESVKMTREMYLEECKKENVAIRKEYGPILITYIRKPQKLVLPPYKMKNEELLKFYHTNFQNVPIGCVVAVRISGEIHYGWSLCNKKDRFNKVICLNRALNRAINGVGNTSYFVASVPILVEDYLDNLKVRANKYFNKYDNY